jgi:predicted amidohydrolase
MPIFKVACAQFDCRLRDKKHNLDRMRGQLREAAKAGAHLLVFPECALTGYAYENKEEPIPLAEPLPGLASEAFAKDCRDLGIHVIFGLIEQSSRRDDFYNACALVGPSGFIASYRKVHLPFLGLDRFALPGDRPFAVHDIGGLRVGMNICYDGSFPESARVLTLLGADLIVLPTNWPTGAINTVKHLVQCRAMENHVYYAAANRVGEERGFRFIGQSRIIDCSGDLLASASADRAEIVYAEIDPAHARQKRIIKIPGQYEIDRVADRRPEMYGPLVAQGTGGKTR